MSRQDAPLYVRSHDLARSLLDAVVSWPDAPRRVLGEPLATEVRTLLTAVALALAFPDDRAAHQRAADDALLRLRVLLRLATAMGLISEGAASAAHAELTDMGRMLGGWRKREYKRLEKRSASSERDLR